MSTATSPADTLSNKLYVGNIEYATTKAELQDLFKDYAVYVLIGD
jgi:RNA recognition motif-containing protein